MVSIAPGWPLNQTSGPAGSVRSTLRSSGYPGREGHQPKGFHTTVYLRTFQQLDVLGIEPGRFCERSTCSPSEQLLSYAIFLSCAFQWLHYSLSHHLSPENLSPRGMEPGTFCLLQGAKDPWLRCERRPLKG